MNYFAQVREGLRERLRAFVLGEGAFYGHEAEWGHDDTTYSPAEYGDYLVTSNAVFVCSRMRAEQLAGFPPKAYRFEKDGRKKEVKGGEAMGLLQRVNPFWTRNRLMRMTELCLCLWGRGYWFIERGGPFNKGAPKEIWWGRSDRVTVYPHETKYISGFGYEPMDGGEELFFEPHEVIWFRYPNPLDEFGSLSPIAAARLAADLRSSAAHSNKRLFDQGLMLGGFLSPKNSRLSPEQAKQLEKSIARRFAGQDKAHRWGVLRFEAEMKGNTVTPHDAEFLGTLNWGLDEIARAYGIPLDLIGGQRTYANVQSSERSLIYRTMMPEAQFIAEELTEQYLPMFKEKVDLIEFDLSNVPVLQDAESEQWKREEGQIERGTMLINEWRESKGMDPVPWGDVWWVPFGMGPVDGPTADLLPASAGGNGNQLSVDSGQLSVRNLQLRTGVRKSNQSGAMVALFLPGEAAKTLALSQDQVPDGSYVLPASELHITLAYLGDKDEAEVPRDVIERVMIQLAADEPLVVGSVGGLGRFEKAESDGTNAFYASFDSSGLSKLREKIVDALQLIGADVSMEHGFTPHITLAYIPESEPTPDVEIQKIKIEMEALYLAWGNELVAFSLLGERRFASNQRAVEYGSQEHERLHRRYVRRVVRREREVRETVRGLLERQRESVVVKIAASGERGAGREGPEGAEGPEVTEGAEVEEVLVALMAALAFEEWVKRFREGMRPTLRVVYEDVGQEALDDLALLMGFDVDAPEVVRAMERQVQAFATQVNETTWKDLRRVLAEGLEEGEGIDALMGRVKGVFDGYMDTDPAVAEKLSRLEAIARTETVAVSNGGTMEAWRQSGVVESKTWLSALLPDRTRDWHADAHGQTVALDADFEVGGEAMAHPGDRRGSPENVINCLCSMTAGVRV